MVNCSSNAAEKTFAAVNVLQIYLKWIGEVPIGRKNVYCKKKLTSKSIDKNRCDTLYFVVRVSIDFSSYSPIKQYVFIIFRWTSRHPSVIRAEWQSLHRYLRTIHSASSLWVLQWISFKCHQKAFRYSYKRFRAYFYFSLRNVYGTQTYPWTTRESTYITWCSIYG